MMQQYKQQGFTIIELMGVLLIFSAIILGSYKLVNYLSEKNKAIAHADKVQVVAHSVAGFMVNNYRTLNNSMIGSESILTQADLNSALPELIQANSDLKLCLYIVRDAKDALTSYLILANDDLLSARVIANTIGNNGYTVQAENNSYRLAGINKSNQVLSNNAITLLNSKCGFKQSVINSVFIDISRYNNFTSPSKGATDSQLTSGDNTPAIKSQGTSLITKSSVILDNVVKEAYTYQTKHCNVSSLPANDPATLCNQNLGANMGMYQGTASWVSSTLSADQQSCTGIARARFYRTDVSYTCSGVALPAAQNYCSNTSSWVSQNLYGYQVANSPKYLIQGTAIWSPNPPVLQGNTCVSQAYARYQYPHCNYTCSQSYTKWGPYHLTCSEPDFQALCNTKKGNDVFPLSYTVHDTPGAILGNYQSNGKCDAKFYCSDWNGNHGYYWWGGPWSLNVNPRYVQDSNYTACNSVAVAAQPVYTQVDIGYFNCSVTKSYTSITQTNGVPEEHQYRALDLGLSTQGNNSRVQVKTVAKSGVASSLTELSVSRSGMNAGFVVPENVDTMVGTACNANDLGRIVKQNITATSLSGGQLQCMYNPTLCHGNSYCYLSVKDTSYTIKFKIIRSAYSCPSGTFVSNDQPSDVITNGFVCPGMTGYTVIKQTYTRYLNPYSSVYDNSQIYQTLQTACDYRNNSNGQIIVIAVNALSKVTCSTLNKTYEVNNYQQ